MGLFDGIKRQLLTNIRWENPQPGVLIWKFPQANDELKNCSTLIIDPGQGAIFVYEGKVQAVHGESGSFDIKTANIPFLTTLASVMRSFDSKHKAEVFFVNLKEITNQKWGTKSPLKYVDPQYKFPVGLRAFGNYSFKIMKPEFFFTNFSGTKNEFTVDDFRETVTNRILTPLTDALAEAKFGYTEIDSQREELTAKLLEKLKPDFTKLGFELTDFRLENTDFDEATQKLIAKIAESQATAQAVNALGSVDQGALANFAQVEKLKALNTAASQEGGAAGMGVGLGAGLGMGQMMAQGMQQPQSQAPAGGGNFCSSCGAKMVSGVKFCGACGAKVS